MSNRLRELREEKGLTLKELVDDLKKVDLKISSDTLAKYERGDREPKLERWQKLADYYDVPIPYLQGLGVSKSKVISYLIDGLKDPNSWKKYDNDIHSIVWKNLSNDEKARVISILNKNISEIEKNRDLNDFIVSKYPVVNNYSFLASMQGNELSRFNELAIISHIDNSITNKVNANIYSPRFDISESQKDNLFNLFEDVIIDYSTKINALEKEIQDLRNQLSK